MSWSFVSWIVLAGIFQISDRRYGKVEFEATGKLVEYLIVPPDYTEADLMVRRQQLS